MVGIAEETVKDRFARKGLATHAPQRMKREFRVLCPSAAESVCQKGDVDVLVDCLKSCLVDANRGLQSAYEQVVNLVVA